MNNKRVEVTKEEIAMAGAIAIASIGKDKDAVKDMSAWEAMHKLVAIMAVVLTEHTGYVKRRVKENEDVYSED